MSPSDAVERFVATGEYDPRFAEWPGGAIERRRRGEAAFREVLRRIVGYRAARGPARRVPEDVGGLVRARVAPMVDGILGEPDAATFLDGLDARVHVVTPGTFPRLVDTVAPRVGWDLANLLLDDLGAPPLADDTPELDGLCAGGRAWLLPRAFDEARPGSDVVAHEVAHLLHTVRVAELRGGVGGPRLVPVPPRRHETFAYACELWAWTTRTGAALPGEAAPDDARVDRAALARVLDAAARGGWAVLRAWGMTGRLPEG